MNYKKLYENIVTNRKQNTFNGYTETHHIIPKSLGGTDDKENLVDLSAREHFICHLLLTKMYPEGSVEWIKMTKAFMCMMFRQNDYQKRYLNSKWYKYLRETFSTIQSINQSGKNNSQYGKCWIINPSTEEKKSIKKEFLQEYLAKGWLRGRTLKETRRMSGGKYRKLSTEQKQISLQKRITKLKESKKINGKLNCYINKQTQEKRFFGEKETVDLNLWKPVWEKYDIKEIEKFLQIGKTWNEIAKYYKTSYYSIYSWYKRSKKYYI